MKISNALAINQPAQPPTGESIDEFCKILADILARQPAPPLAVCLPNSADKPRKIPQSQPGAMVH